MGRIAVRTARRPARKAKKSYTLSQESVKFLERVRRQRRAASVSSVLDELIFEARPTQELARIDQETKEYYDSLTDEEAKELSELGEFATRKFQRMGED